MNLRRPRNPTASDRPERRTSLGTLNQTALRQGYERSLALANAKSLAGDRIEAERHWQQAEYYLRSLAERAA
ncbi:DUF4167 domain-containing protein [Bosea sp. (in: a-proteobacteria)]|uniref:DUF4167 domain-containing protein n=1 Tax=Bosea sp. (in: a-proteobacteria) TaxID=1871050 RepID=UPI002FC6FF29